MNSADHDSEYLVSVVIPTFNRTEFLSRAVRSVLNQTYKNIEILVIDDGSTHTQDIAEVLGCLDDDRIRYLKHAENRGGSAARNTGIENARGAFVAFLDDDDEWLPQKLTYQMRRFRENPKAGAVYTGFISVEAGTKKVVDIHIPGKRGNLFDDLLVGNIVGTTSSVVVRRECLDRVGLFDEKLRASQDVDLWRRLSKECYFDFVEVPLVRYSVHGLKQISKDHDAAIEAFEAQLEKFKDNFEINRKAHSIRYYWIGVNHLGRGDIRQARQALKKAIALYPARVNSYPWLAVSYLGNAGLDALRLFERHIWRRYKHVRGASKAWVLKKKYGCLFMMAVMIQFSIG